MENKKNRQIRLARKLSGMPSRENFEITESALPSPGEGEVLTENLYVSVDPYMRSRMDRSATGRDGFDIHDVIRGRTIGRVWQSRDQTFGEGDYVMGMMGWEEYSVMKTDGLTKLDPGTAPLSANLGVIGMTGLTAYFGLLAIGQPRAGEHVVVSGAAGAVGNVAGQIARIKGCHVTGIAGSDAKIKKLREELHFDDAINYHDTKDLSAEIARACPNGVDIYFDNVGGVISDAVLQHLNRNARIAICGQISLYNLTEQPVGPRVQPVLLAHSALMQGFMVNNFASEFPEAQKQLGKWLKEGKLNSTETILEGFEKIPEAFLGLFTGENTGKLLVKLK